MIKSRPGGYEGRKENKMTLYDKALRTLLASRFVSRADDLNRPLTDEEVREEAQYQLEDLPYKGIFEGRELQTAKRQMKALLK
jgi:hypothetical protein